MQENKIIVGDIGGTNSRFAEVELAAGKTLKISRFFKFQNDLFDQFKDVLSAYIRTSGTDLTTATLAVAGPVDGNTASLTNRDWLINASDISQSSGISHITIINDFKAMARSAPELDTNHYTFIVNAEGDTNSPHVVGGAGTGFGLGTLIPFAKHWNVLAGEGGHQIYAPSSDLEIELLRQLRRFHEVVTLESVTGGKHFETLAEAIGNIYGKNRFSISQSEAVAKALKNNPICLDICLVRARAIMSAMGDAMLICGAKGGVWLAGGVTELLEPFLNRQDVLPRFYERGPMSKYMEKTPIKLIKSPDAPLLGAAASVLLDQA